MYYSPTGWKYFLLKNIEAYFGVRMLAGLEIPDIEAARGSVKLDENGKPINVARKENVQEMFTHQMEPKKKKRRRLFATDDDFRECDFLSVVQLRASTTSQELEKIGVADAAALSSQADAIHKTLQKRGFSNDTQVVYVNGRRKDIALSSDLPDLLSGVYYQRPEDFNGYPCYQQIAISEINPGRLACSYLYLFWSAERGCWKLGQLNDAMAGFARCFDSNSNPASVNAKWLLYGYIPS